MLIPIPFTFNTPKKIEMNNTRRDFIKTTALAAGAISLGINSNAKPANFNEYPYTLPQLPYAYNALEPHIDEKTMMIHHDKHHQAYVDKLNAGLEKFPDYQQKGLQNLFSQIIMLPADLKMVIRNHGGGHWNHSFFWNQLSPTTSQPSEKLASAINSTFGSIDKLKEEMNKTAMTIFGSGWVWLIETAMKELKIVTTPNQYNPLMGDAADKGAPLIAIDVWEHAYYLKYQNKRADYLEAIWNVINWNKVSDSHF